MAGLDEDDIQYFSFLPGERSVTVGDTVTWLWNATEDPHTVTFHMPDEPPEFFLIEPQAAGPPNLVFNPEAVAPAGGNIYSGSGFFSSGMLFGPSGPPGPTSYSLTFDTPGTFMYMCLVHGPLMRGSITVEAPPSALAPSVGDVAPSPWMLMAAGLVGLGLMTGGAYVMVRRARA